MNILGDRAAIEAVVHNCKNHLITVIKDQPELSAAISFVAGMIFILAFRVLFFLIVLGAVIFYGLWLFADRQPPGDSSSST